MTRRRFLCHLAIVGTLGGLAVPCRAEPIPVHGPARATVLIIRHAEKPDTGDGLTPAGETRAKNYAAYFKDFKFRAEPVKLDTLFAAADSRNSRRPRLTVGPLAAALGLNVNTAFKDRDCQGIADELRVHHAGGNVLICWHHGAIVELLEALGADPQNALPDGQWPSSVYNWVIVLRYDADGKLAVTQREVEPF